MSLPSNDEGLLIKGTRRNRSLQEWFILLFLSFWCLGATFWLIHIGNFLIHAKHSQGIVTDLIFQQGGRGSNYAPVVRFSDSTGRSQTLRCAYGNFQNLLPMVGDKVDIIYDPWNPSEFFINNFPNFWLGPLIFSIAVMVISFVIRWIWKRE